MLYSCNTENNSYHGVGILIQFLYNIVLPYDCINCANLLCTNIIHTNSIQLLHDQIILTLLRSSEVIPETGIKSKNIPGWNDYIKHLKLTASFWINLWRDNNSPLTGQIHDIMKETRRKCHYGIRNVKINEEDIKKQKIAETLCDNNSRQFWLEVKKIRNKNTLSSQCIDNISGDENIANLFLHKYNQLYNSVHCDDTEMSTLCDENVNDIHVHCIANPSKHKHSHCITVEQVKFAINKLKPGKSDSTDGLLSDNFKNGTHLLYSYIALLFTCMLTHGVSPIDFCLSVIVPIPKNKRANKCDSSNYRAIAIGSLLGYFLDNVIFEDQYTYLSTDVLQFGYKRCSSTTICTTLLLETIAYYRENRSDCFLLLLDASKAFDCVEYVKLFQTLRDRKICPTVLRLIMHMYVNQKILIRWNQLMSHILCYF